MYSPTTSSSFSTNFGSREILKPRTRWGFRPCARQIRSTVVSLTPLRGQGARAPLSGRRRQGLGRAPHDLCRIYHALAPATGQVLLDSRKATLRVALPPATHLHTADLQLRCNGLSQALRANNTMHARRASCTSVVFDAPSRFSASLPPHSVRSFAAYPHRWTLVSGNPNMRQIEKILSFPLIIATTGAVPAAAHEPGW